MVISTFEVQWDNGEEVQGVGGGEGELTEENRQVFKDVVDSVRALARQVAK